MRKLKFKLWDTYNKIWLDVSKFNIRLDNLSIQNNECAWIINWVEIVEYTWLNDKLWNPIYDWDILRKPTGTIDWKQNYRYEIVKEHNITVNDWGIIIGWFEFNDDIDDYELWGNIYENKYPWTFNFESPELLNN